MLTKLQAIQSILNAALSEIGTIAGERVDNILSNINQTLKIPGLLTAVSKTVTVGSTTYALPSGKQETLTWNGRDFGGLGGTFNFSTGVGTGDVQSTTPPTILNGEYCKAGFEIRSDKLIYVCFGSVTTSPSTATFPPFSSMSMPLGYTILQGGPGGLLDIEPAAIFQFFSLPSIVNDHANLTNRDASNAHPSASISVDTAGFSGELSAVENNNQLAISRLEKYGSIFPWASGKSYRVGNVVKHRGILWECIVAHISGATFIESNWLILEEPKQEAFTVGAGGQFVFTLSTLEVPDSELRLQVFVNGVRQISGTHYVVNSATEVEFSEALPQDAEVLFFLP